MHDLWVVKSYPAGKQITASERIAGFNIEENNAHLPVPVQRM